MPVISYKVGPGVLSFDSPVKQFATQVRSCRVVPAENVKTVEAVPMLSGDILAEEETASYKYTLVVSFQQDLTTSGVIDWTWDNAGLTKAFSYTPNTAQGTVIAGNIRVVPLEVGGDADTRPTSDATFAIIGTPTKTP